MLLIIGFIGLMIFVFILILSEIDVMRNKMYDLEDIAAKGVKVCNNAGKEKEREYFLGIEHACKCINFNKKEFENCISVLESEIKKYEKET